MPALRCSAMTCVYNDGELCSKGDIKVGGKQRDDRGRDLLRKL